jgi:RNA polymerase sigma-70 factor (ECF subfamily)
MDLVQSVHRSLLVGLRDGRFDISSPDRLIGLAMVIVRRKAAGKWRHLQRQQRLSGGDSTSGNLPAVLAELTTPEGDPAQTAQYHDQLEQLCRQLDRAERRMLELRLAGYSTGEIAEQLGVNPVTLRVRMTRLRERLRSSGLLDGWF